jgi:hypothetical protein
MGISIDHHPTLQNTHGTSLEALKNLDLTFMR